MRPINDHLLAQHVYTNHRSLYHNMLCHTYSHREGRLVSTWLVSTERNRRHPVIVSHLAADECWISLTRQMFPWREILKRQHATH